MFDRRLVENFDWGLLFIVTLISAFGITILYSAVNAGVETSQRILVKKQLIWLAVGYAVMTVTFLINYKNLESWSSGIYLGSIILLVCVLFFGKHVAGSRRWLALGPFTVQPSELVKIAVIIALAKYYSKNTTTRGYTLKTLIKPLLIVCVPCLLILKQPDLGTSLSVVIIAFSMTFFVKIERRTLIFIFGFVMSIIPLAWAFVLKGYQKQRVLTFLNPDLDPLGAGYHIIQSKIAIGSGMLYGKGYLKGTQNALSFLPEQHTDFILSVLAEEWGMAGSGMLVLLYIILVGCGLNIAHNCRNSFGMIMAVGVTAMIFWQIIINMGMVMGLLPVVGVPLPLISYGGSSVLTTLIGIGLLMNVSMRKFIKT